ncbi:uncharacterized protein [Periplaneta americana]|uniref:uncharacterized protein n=1 Tax=Periplaneta americana TaxID=6978 RepID=UPI0037E8DE3E
MKRILEMYKPPILAAFGNPLLDMCTKISDFDILKKYGLVENGQKEVADGDLEIFREVRKSFDVEYHPGGAAQNTLRIFQWLIQCPFYSVYFGGIGNDGEGKLLEKLVKASGVETRYAYHEGVPTGSCLALISGENRSLIGHLGAANIYKPSDLTHHMQTLHQVNIIYIESFFISHSYDAALALLEVCYDRGIPLVFNIGATYMCEGYGKEVSHLAKSANILFGNKEEYKALSKVMDLDCQSIKQIAVTLHEMSEHQTHVLRTHELGQYFDALGKVLVVTDGRDPVLCVHGRAGSGPSVSEYPVPVLDDKLIRDTTGAGDSFVAGFLAGVFLKHSPQMCTAWGCWSARQIIQLMGCQVPSYPPDAIYKLKI